VARLEIDGANALYFEHDPAPPGAATFVFVNALTGSAAQWQAAVAPRCRAAGFGTLCWNFRGQEKSPFAPGLALDADLITADLARLLAYVAPARPVLVGLSIGGLYAARAVLAGAPAAGLVLLNTLRRIGPRLAWINRALLHAVATGGLGLFRDLYLPLLVNEETLAGMRDQALQNFDYPALPPDHGHYKLIEGGLATDWDVPWEAVAPPVLTVTGLQDRVFLEPAVVAELRARLPDARHLEWADAGHLLPAERPERLADALAAFAREIG